MINQRELLYETLAKYQEHGWRLARVLLKPETLSQLNSDKSTASNDPSISINFCPPVDNTPPQPHQIMFQGLTIRESSFDALWFTRESSGGREAWELRALSQPPFALLELFEPGELEEDREDVRREMESRLAERQEG